MKVRVWLSTKILQEVCTTTRFICYVAMLKLKIVAVISFCAPSVALTNRKVLLRSFVLIFFKVEHGAVNRQSYLDTGYFSAVTAV